MNSVSLLVHKGWWATHKPPAKQSISRRSSHAHRVAAKYFRFCHQFFIPSLHIHWSFASHVRSNNIRCTPHNLYNALYGVEPKTHFKPPHLRESRRAKSKAEWVLIGVRRSFGYILYNAIWTITTTAQKKLYNYNKVQTRSALVIEFFCLAVVSALLII